MSSNYLRNNSVQFSSGTQSCPTLWDPVDYIQHTRLPCPSPTSRACSHSCPLSQWCTQLCVCVCVYIHKFPRYPHAMQVFSVCRYWHFKEITVQSRQVNIIIKQFEVFLNKEILHSCIWLFATLWTVACQVPLSVRYLK